MAGRRQHGEGSVYQRSGDRRWVATVPETAKAGKRQRRVFTGTTAAEARKRRERFLERKRDGFTMPKGRPPYVSEWVLHWFHTSCKRKVEATTWQGYKSKVEQWIVPFFEGIPLPDLTEEDIEEWHLWMEAQVSKKTKNALSGSTIGQTHRILSTCIKAAVGRRRCPRNVVSPVTPPSDSGFEIEPPAIDEVYRIIARCASWPNGARWVLAITTGLRQGEALALVWSQVKLNDAQPSIAITRSAARVSGEGRVVKAPKSESSVRSVPLPPEAVDALRDFRDAQEVRGIGTDDVLFRGKRGAPVHPSVDYADWRALLADLGLPHYRTHDLRHAYATMLLEQGKDPRVVQAMLGHSTVALLKRYQHVRPVLHADVADAISRAITPR